MIPHLVQPVKLGDWWHYFRWCMCTRCHACGENKKVSGQISALLQPLSIPEATAEVGGIALTSLALTFLILIETFFCQPKGTGGLQIWTHQS